MPKKKATPKDPKLIIDDPYIFEQCQVDIHLVLFPESRKSSPRQAALSISSHGDVPLFEIHPDAWVLIDDLPAQIRALIDRFQAELPERHLSRLRRTAESAAKKKPAPKTPASTKPSTQAKTKVTKKKQLSLIGD